MHVRTYVCVWGGILVAHQPVSWGLSWGESLYACVVWGRAGRGSMHISALSIVMHHVPEWGWEWHTFDTSQCTHERMLHPVPRPAAPLLQQQRSMVG